MDADPVIKCSLQLEARRNAMTKNQLKKARQKRSRLAKKVINAVQIYHTLVTSCGGCLDPPRDGTPFSMIA